MKLKPERERVAEKMVTFNVSAEKEREREKVKAREERGTEREIHLCINP